MTAFIQEIDVERLYPIFNIPQEIRNSRVEVTIRPIEKKLPVSEVTDRINKFKEKYNRETFVKHLKEQVSKGQTFAFDVQKVIDGTETEEDVQARYSLEKQAWGNAVKDVI